MMGVVRTVGYTFWCNEERCASMPRSRSTVWVNTKREAVAIVVRDGWTVKRNDVARCPDCNKADERLQ